MDLRIEGLTHKHYVGARSSDACNFLKVSSLCSSPWMVAWEIEIWRPQETSERESRSTLWAADSRPSYHHHSHYHFPLGIKMRVTRNDLHEGIADRDKRFVEIGFRFYHACCSQQAAVRGADHPLVRSFR
jgi:hypothetical protein